MELRKRFYLGEGSVPKMAKEVAVVLRQNGAMMPGMMMEKSPMVWNSADKKMFVTIFRELGRSKVRSLSNDLSNGIDSSAGDTKAQFRVLWDLTGKQESTMQSESQDGDRVLDAIAKDWEIIVAKRVNDPKDKEYYQPGTSPEKIKKMVVKMLDDMRKNPKVQAKGALSRNPALKQAAAKNGIKTADQWNSLFEDRESLSEGKSRLQLVPAYGRDYKSKKEVEAAWNDGKDFMIQDMSSPDDGRYINIEDAKNDGDLREVNVRFKRLTQVAVIKIKRGAGVSEGTDNQTLLRFANSAIYLLDSHIVPQLEQQIKTIEYSLSGRGHISDATDQPVLDPEESKKAKKMQGEIRAFIAAAKKTSDTIYRLTK